MKWRLFERQGSQCAQDTLESRGRFDGMDGFVLMRGHLEKRDRGRDREIVLVAHLIGDGRDVEEIGAARALVGLAARESGLSPMLEGGPLPPGADLRDL